MRWSKIMALFLVIYGVMIVMGSGSWFTAWIGLEVNLVGILSLMVKSDNSLSSEAGMKYFLLSVLSSILLLYSGLVYSLGLTFMFTWSSVMYFSLMIKLAVPPFHYWLPKIIEGVEGEVLFLMLTWQKFGPFLLLLSSFSFELFIWSVISSAVVGALGGMNQVSLKKLLAFSSMSHTSWIILSLFYYNKLMLFYFVVYSFTVYVILMMISKYKTFSLVSLFTKNFSHKLSFVLVMLSLGGMPPLLGFIPKFYVLSVLSEMNMVYLGSMVLSFSLLNMYYYLRMSFHILYLLNSNLKSYGSPYFFIHWGLFMFLSFMLPFFFLSF